MGEICRILLKTGRIERLRLRNPGQDIGWFFLKFLRVTFGGKKKGRRQAGRTVDPFCRKGFSPQGEPVQVVVVPQLIGVVCYSPMGKGLLTGTFTADRVAELSVKDHRTRDPRFLSPQLEINLTFVEALRTIAEELGWSIPELSIAWVLRRSELTSAIVGSRRPDQLTATVQAGERILPEDAARQMVTAIDDRDQALADVG